MRYLRRIIPQVAGMIGVFIYAVPVLFYLHSVPDTDVTNAVLWISGAFMCYIGGDVAGVFLNNYLLKKLSPERYRMIVLLIAVVTMLLMMILAIGCLLWLIGI